MPSPDSYAVIAAVAVALLTTMLIRLTMVLPQYRPVKRLKRNPQKCPGKSTMIFVGSGGHTGEMVTLLARFVGIQRYRPLHMVLAHSDSTSYNQIQKSGILSSVDTVIWHTVYRSREVKQGWITTLFTVIISSLQAILLVFTIQPDLLICNGPGTCVPLCYAAFLLRFAGIKDASIVFVESFCRVKDLSLSGKLVYPIAGIRSFVHPLIIIIIIIIIHTRANAYVRM